MLNNKIPRSKSAFTLIELSIVLIIIGLLVGGVTGASSLIYSAKLKSARMMSKSSAVIASEDLLLWFDATAKDAYSEGEGLSDESDVTTFKNVSPQSSRGDLNQSTDSLKPHYLKSGINGLPSLKFTGPAQNKLTATTFPEFNHNGFTLFAAVKFTKNNVSSNSLIKLLNTQDSGGINFYRYTGGYAFGKASSGGGAGFAYSSHTVAAILVIKYDNNVQNIELTGGGKTHDMSMGSYYAADIDDKFDQIIVSNPTSTADADFLLGEMIVYSKKLSDSEIANIKKYLVKKWGM